MAKFEQLGSKETNSTYTGTTLSGWSRQQKIAMIASLAILGLLLAMSACSKQAPKSALVAVSSPAPAPINSIATPATTTATDTAPAAPKQVRKLRPATVTYSDPSFGVSFQYPRKYALTAGTKTVPAMNGVDPLPMNFVETGGIALATVEMPGGSYPGTDFTTAFFHVNVNRSLTEQQCSQFAFVDTHNADGEKAEPEKVELGAVKLNKTTGFDSNVLKQAEAEYYHRYENGACYEFVLGLGTQGYGTVEGIEPVSREEVFTKLEKILATVKIAPAVTEQVATAATSAVPEATK
jgi:hypothetical protein